MKPGVNPVWKIVSNNMHVFVIDFCACANMRGFALFIGIFTRPPQHEWHMYAKTPYSKQLAICG